jgi:hemolysin activation/secretion protein
VYEYVVNGNSLISDAVIEAALSPYMGDKKSVADVEKARAALEKTYQDAGYLTVLVTIPEQKVDEGSVVLQVLEASVQRTSVKGAEYTLPSAVKALVPELAENKVPNFNVVQEQLAAINSRSTLKATPVLRAGSQPGRVEVQLDVDDRPPVSGSVELNNRQTSGTTPTRISASMRYDNLWQLGHSLGISAQVAPERIEDARVFSGTYTVPVGAGNSATAYWVSSRSSFASLPGAPDLGLLGTGDILGLRYSHKLHMASDRAFVGTVGLDRKDLRQTLFVRDAGSFDTPIIYTPLMANLNASYFTELQRASLDSTVVLGVRGLLGDTDAEFSARRKGATASFLAVRSTFNYSRNIGTWLAVGRLGTQVSANPLLPSEQMIAGGVDTVRGYYEGEQAGDYGANLSLEARTPMANIREKLAGWQLGYVAFVDMATVGKYATTAAVSTQATLASVGVGLRWNGPSKFRADADIARALVDGSTTQAGETRLHARGIWAF